MGLAVTIYELVLGAVLLLAPWSRIWEENWVLWRCRVLEPWVMTGPVRGAVSGLGAAFVLSAVGKLLRIPLVDEDGPSGPS